MSNKIRVLIQMKYTQQISMAAVKKIFSVESVKTIDYDGVLLDERFVPIKVPKRVSKKHIRATEVGSMFTYDFKPEVSSYLVRAEVEDDGALYNLNEKTKEDPNVIGIFSDPVISTVVDCSYNTVGDHEDVANLLETVKLKERGMDGTGVKVAIVDTGINMDYLGNLGLNPNFDSANSWTPVSGLTPGDMDVDHGTMCAFDACIAAPNCTLLDYALLQSQAPGGWNGFLSDAISAYSKMIEMLETETTALVVNNSWGMFDPSSDFPVGHPGNYSDNPDHPFNIIVESLEDAGADILFAAGNCGSECPDGRCEGPLTGGTIYGANSHPNVLTVAAVTTNVERLGYSSEGPGRLDIHKPDICAYSHFSGSQVYPADGGTSAASPVAAGVVAAIRTKCSVSDCTPAQLQNIIRTKANDLGNIGFDYAHGYGLINVPGILEVISPVSSDAVTKLELNQTVSAQLNASGDTLMFSVDVGDTLNIELDGQDGVDFDLYVKKDAHPAPDNFDYQSSTYLADEQIKIKPFEKGRYFVMVKAYSGSGNFTLKASLEE